MASNGSNNGAGSSDLQRLEEADRRRKELLAKRQEQQQQAKKKSGVPPLNSPNAKANANAKAKAKKNGTYLVMITTCLVTTIILNVMHHSLSGGGAHDASYRAAEAFIGAHFRTVMGLAEEEEEDVHASPGLRYQRKKHRQANARARTRIEAHAEGGAGGHPAAAGAVGTANDAHEEPPLVAAVAAAEATTIAREEHHPLGGLHCADHGGPSDAAASEMVFWSDIPADAAYKSPFYHKDPKDEKYLSFEPDHGGWNNIRMAMETTLVIAHATGRTLVLPPEKDMYLLNKDRDKHKTQFTFNDFFHLDSIAVEHPGFNVITMEEFLKRRGAMEGKFKSQQTGEVLMPPDQRTDWNGQNLKPLFDYLRQIGNVPIMDPWKCAFAVPASPDPADVKKLNDTLHDIVSEKGGRKKPTVEEFIGNPTPVDASLEDRMREMLADRQQLCIYDEEMQAAPLIHFKVDKESRLLTHFYAFVFFADWRQDLWSKRFVRDHVRYIDDIVCAAARIVEKVRERARALGDPHNPKKGNKAGIYDSMHVRRGDFQYKPTRLDADVLYNKSRNELTTGATLYIATDERDKTFFKFLRAHYDICFLDDFMDVIKGVNTNYYGMLDQLVASKGRVFYGTWWSTLSGYVNRMRGYYIAKHKLEGYENGTMQSYYFFPDERKMQMRTYTPVRHPIYMREFPTSWRDLEKGLEDFHVETKAKATAKG